VIMTRVSFTFNLNKHSVVIY